MKKFGIFVVLAVTAVMIAVSMAGCINRTSSADAIDNPFVENNTPMEYTAENGYVEVDGMSAFDLLVETHDNWLNDKAYKRVEVFDFSTGSLAKRNCYTFYKVDGDKFYKQDVTITTGLVEDNKGERVYYDGEKVYSIYFDDKKRVPGDESDLFHVTDWGKYSEWQEGDRYADLAAMKEALLQHMTTYIWNDRANLSQSHVDKVYEKDGKYYFTLTINCSQEMMDNVHTAARDEFIANTGGDEGSLKMSSDTTIDFIVDEIDGEYKFIAWRRTENYSGKKIVKLECTQTSISLFEYTPEAYTINETDLMELA